ncbi:oxidative stress survival, Svf1-like protein [Calycina marina]|uniref:Oxidative stress survival, Svf1-like protein n=1 Tax=Calycina marina TaxID=1763456 RepID=A0A9P8CCA8_9HELO|nr:oxidative stress survival, Svf1-like protein [Calycina marina]
MMNWMKQQAANVAGTAEPIYGASAIQPVAKQAELTPYTELTKKDLTWTELNSTNVETQSFYLMADSGHLAVVQIIYSNVMGVHTTCQFSTKIFYPKSEAKKPLWASDPLSNVDISDDKHNFYADNLAFELSEDGTEYSLKSMTNKKALVNLKVKKSAPGFVVGMNGKSTYGTDSTAPWGSLRHAFWPRNTVTGSITTEDGPVDFTGKGLYIMALQFGKPHHLAKKWNFANFQGNNYSAVMMEFQTPPSYGDTIVNVGGIVKDGEIITASSSNSVTHTRIKGDPDNDWPAPEAVKFVWAGKAKDGKEVSAILEGPLDEKIDRIDIMAEVPSFVKSIVSAAAGTKPYVYQYSPEEHPITLKLKIGDEEITEEGLLFSEATFISA